MVVLHGALRSRIGLMPTAWMLNRSGLCARTFGYPTRSGSLADHAAALARFVGAWLASDAPVPTLGFLTHSMGGLVVRAYLARSESHHHARSFRVVMLSPPNQGSTLARSWAENRLFRWLYGQSVDALAGPALALPPVDFGRTRVLVLAGGTPDGRGYTSRIPGNDDGVVGLCDMGLPGCEPAVVGGLHAWLQWRPAVLQRAAHFLETGQDESQEKGGSASSGPNPM